MHPTARLVLIVQRAPGTIVHLGLSRGSQTTTADLVFPSP